eukprot:4301771-Amphidinium_carterae.1
MHLGQAFDGSDVLRSSSNLRLCPMYDVTPSKAIQCVRFSAQDKRGVDVHFKVQNGLLAAPIKL